MPVVVGTAFAASVMPGVVGSRFAMGERAFSWPRALASLIVGIGIQIMTNLVNDVADFRRGADTHERLGPPRVTQLGLLSQRQVVTGAGVCFFVAGFAGLWLASISSWWILVPGGLALLCGIAYTAGPAPIAYLGLSEIFVLAFFGVFATVGSGYVQAGHVVSGTWTAGVALGLLAVAILEANNIRDIPTDTKAGKRTLAVRLGDHRSRWLFAAAVTGAILAGASTLPWKSAALLAALAGAYAWLPVRAVIRGAAGRDMIRVLQRISLLEFLFGLSLAILVAGSMQHNVIKLIR